MKYKYSSNIDLSYQFNDNSVFPKNINVRILKKVVPQRYRILQIANYKKKLKDKRILKYAEKVDMRCQNGTIDV